MSRNRKNLVEKEKTSVEVKVDVAKIVKYCVIAGVAIVGVIFGTRAWLKAMELEKKDM